MTKQFTCHYCGSFTRMAPVPAAYSDGFFPSCCANERCIEQWEIVKSSNS